MSQTQKGTEKNTSKKVKALLAGGLVLGVGAAVTLASWTDRESASATFNSGTFVLESSTNGQDFTSHESEGEQAELKFDIPAENLTPGQHIAAPFALRLDNETTYGATVVMDGPAGDEMGLQYGVASVESIDQCTSTSIPDKMGSAVGFNLAAGEGRSSGEPEILCFHVQASDDLQQGKTANPTWTFTATSTDA